MNLYSPHTGGNNVFLQKFLDNLPIPSLSPEHKGELEAPFTDGEVLGVIKNLKMGLTPGPDGLSNPYYKTFAETLFPHLTKFINPKTQGNPLDP